ncbi:uncharacterized protein N7515_002438 [Penicillium bovifimosum]|uniref:Uncharacterized protein n=1 Tax=Penicillium bovifimosum TaxID=126998 RepID=A0A9W9HBK1_9EURO|nr:uncharacterized protein N7515_002438 [Penicillium bovifimosum]KAJ5143651.1 hypothetical protein N7515_002438 [Penicillium bovifimosum]
MTKTFTTAGHPPTAWTRSKVYGSEQLLASSCSEEYADKKPNTTLIQSSFPRNFFSTTHISASQNGLLWAVVYAYNHHHKLKLRPEDVWFAILVQIGFYISSHAEQLRHLFVSHDGTRELHIDEFGVIDFTDFGKLALAMTRLIQQEVIDPELRNWAMPDFSTTTASDTIVAAVLMMGSMQQYFSCSSTLDCNCGIPSVTLLGKKEDWALLARKVNYLKTLGDEPSRFAQLLQPVLNNFVECLNPHNSREVHRFWRRCVVTELDEDGQSCLKGWITVFCFWDKDGKMLYPEEIHAPSSQVFQDAEAEFSIFHPLLRRVRLCSVPAGYSTMPVTVDDNGREYKAKMLAGSIGIQATSSGGRLECLEEQLEEWPINETLRTIDTVSGQPTAGTRRRELNTIQPASGWLMYETK